MTDYKNQSTGETVRGKELFMHVKSGAWDAEESEDGSFDVTTEEGEEFVLTPVNS